MKPSRFIYGAGMLAAHSQIALEQHLSTDKISALWSVVKYDLTVLSY